MSALVAELEAGQFRRVRTLWAGMDVHLAVESMLAGKTASRMFVDDVEAPRAAMTWSGHRLYLVGDVGGAGFGEELNRYASTHGQFVAYCSPEAIDGAEKLLSGYRVRRRGRLYYEGDPSQVKAVEPPEGYAVERITGELLGRGLGHTDWVREEMCSERESVEEFLGKSFGFAAVHGGGFACWCMSEYNLGDRCEVGIETVKEHRRRGLAVLVAGAMFRHAAGVGVGRVGWHCWADNAASVATAESLGLRRVAEYTVLAVDAGSTL
ncbi:MAG: GNAT family N-acetyltransferase [Candidatus Bathyarchaeota archaeon]|nr:GNAT family N-acetyltransferase [Candidatus Bathyarchaeota archaeon]